MHKDFRSDFLRKRGASGFTLIELLVVFSLLALLLTVAVPRYFGAIESSRTKVRSQNLETLRDALDKFRADQGHYPTALQELVDKHYLRKIPLDPVTDSSDWVALEDPAKVEVGVFDIAPPAAASPPGIQDAVATPLPQGSASP